MIQEKNQIISFRRETGTHPFGLGGNKKAGRFTSELPSFTNYNPMNISLIYLDHSGHSEFRFERGQKIARWQPSILQNYNPMNISKFESGTST